MSEHHPQHVSQHDPAHLHDLHDVTATSLVYSTNRRNGVDMDVAVRDLATGEEEVVYAAEFGKLWLSAEPDNAPATPTRIQTKDTVNA